MGVNFATSRYKLFVAFGIVKVAILFCVSSLPYERLSNFSFLGSDSPSYYYPALSSLNKLEWSRMPAYSLVIRVAHFISNTYKYDLIVIGQAIFSVVVACLMTQLLSRFVKKPFALLIGVLLVANPYLAFYDLKILRESLSTNFILLSLYFLIMRSEKGFNYLLCGLALTFSFTLRPTALMLLPFFIVFIWFIKDTLINRFKYVIFIVASFILFESAWLSFNYKRFGEFIPLTKSQLYSHYYDNFITYFLDLNGNFGGRVKRDFILHPQPEDIPLSLPPFINMSFKAPFKVEDFYTSKFNSESLQKLESDVGSCLTCFGKNHETKNIWDRERRKREEIFNRVSEMSLSIKREHPFKSHIVAKLIPLGIYISQDLNSKNYVGETAFYFFETRNPYDKAFRGYWNAFYTITLVLGLIGLLCMLFSKSKPLMIISFGGMALFFVYPLVFRYSEWRYMHNAIPFLTIGTGYIIYHLPKLLKRLAF